MKSLIFNVALFVLIFTCVMCYAQFEDAQHEQLELQLGASGGDDALNVSLTANVPISPEESNIHLWAGGFLSETRLDESDDKTRAIRAEAGYKIKSWQTKLFVEGRDEDHIGVSGKYGLLLRSSQFNITDSITISAALGNYFESSQDKVDFGFEEDAIVNRWVKRVVLEAGVFSAAFDLTPKYNLIDWEAAYSASLAFRVRENITTGVNLSGKYYIDSPIDPTIDWSIVTSVLF